MKIIKVKLTEKEEKIINSVIVFFQGLKDCDSKEKRDEYLLNNAFMSRMTLTFGKTEPKDTYMIFSSALIQNIIPYLVAEKNDSIDEIAKNFDEKTDAMLEDMLKDALEENE